jgi:hypothetical protein
MQTPKKVIDSSDEASGSPSSTATTPPSSGRKKYDVVDNAQLPARMKLLLGKSS